MSLQEHLEIHGPLPGAGSRRRQRHERAARLIDEVELAGLTGRGGAAFPTARKLRAVSSARHKPIVLVNAAEGEPASLKDATLLRSAPHLVLDGGVIAAQAVGADELIVCVCERAGDAMQCVLGAVAERAQGEPARITVVPVPGEYVAGQESALVAYLNGGEAKPTFTPPMPFERGVRRRPTLVNNAETLAHLALIVRHGAEWFRRLGTESQPGSTLVTLLGPVAHQGVYEIEIGAPLPMLLEAAGGLTAPARAILLGGYAGSWIDADALAEIYLSNEDLQPLGASLGAGVVLVLGEDACGVAETARVARWLASGSSGQCGPCIHGLDALAGTLEALAGGLRTGRPTWTLEQLGALIRGRGACSHPDGTFRFVASAVEVFAQEFESHAHKGPCQRCRRIGRLPLPEQRRIRMPRSPIRDGMHR